MWHASAAPVRGRHPQRETQAQIARVALTGVGDQTQQWEEWSGYVYHIRRRLTAAEEAQVGPARDLRGTGEGARRFAAIAHTLPPLLVRAAQDELGIALAEGR